MGAFGSLSAVSGLDRHPQLAILLGIDSVILHLGPVPPDATSLFRFVVYPSYKSLCVCIAKAQFGVGPTDNGQLTAALFFFIDHLAKDWLGIEEGISFLFWLVRLSSLSSLSLFLSPGPYLFLLETADQHHGYAVPCHMSPTISFFITVTFTSLHFLRMVA